MALFDLIKETMPAEVFKRPVGFDSTYQGPNRRWLFADSSGLVRSATAVVLAHKVGINARAVGTDFNFALQPITMSLILWAEWVVFMDQQSYDECMVLLEAYPEFKATIPLKSITINVSGEPGYTYMQYELQQLIKQQIPDLQTE